jgi:integrase
MSARAFTDEEINLLDRHFGERNCTRDRLLLLLGVTTGLRIHELLSVTVADLWNGTEVVRDLCIQRARLKGGCSLKRRAVRGRRIPLADNVREIAADHLAMIGMFEPTRAVFGSRQSGAGAMTLFQAYRRLRQACGACGIDLVGVSTHCYRKTFCQAFYNRTKDLLLTQVAMGHANPLTTAVYLRVDQGRADQIIRELAGRLGNPAPVAVLTVTG